MATVREASDPYTHFMRDVPSPRLGVCATCSTFCTNYVRCARCNTDPNYLDAVLPISYSVHLDQLHTALRGYKDAVDARVRRRFQIQLAAVLWRFLSLEGHEDCLARKVGLDELALVTTVPSGSIERDTHQPLREIVGTICTPTAGRYERLLTRSDVEVPDRTVEAAKYAPVRALDGEAVLLIDDTWATGANIQSAAGSLREAGAGVVAAVVVGRHIHRDFRDNDERLRALPSLFDWERCAFH